MKKLFLLLIVLLFAISLLYFWELLADKQILKEDIIRLHVIANSDSEADQSNKLAVRDAVVAYLQENMSNCNTAEEARKFLQSSEEKLEKIINSTLAQLNSSHTGEVSVVEEAFGSREYDTFSLPSGIYHSLKIEIGEAAGRNWWCVVFPALCLPATTSEFQDVSAASGFSSDLTDTLSGEEGYEIRFFLLDCLGKIENFLYFE